MAFELISTVEFRGGTDAEGHREYKVKYKVGTQSALDGPAQAMRTPGLPAVGSTYAFSASEFDPYAWRRPEVEVDPVPGYREGDFPYIWYVTLTFSTKQRRADQERPHPNQQPVEDPLSEPQKISINSVREKEQGVDDRHGNPIRYSTFEPIVGPLNEWDADKDQVVVEQNVMLLDYPVYGPMRNCLNDRPLWGFPPRSIKLSGVQVRINWGKNNLKYYTRILTFDIRVKSGTRTRTTGGNYSGGSLTVTFPQAGYFSVADIGSSITGNGIQSGTTITNVTNTASTSTATLSLVTTGASNAAGTVITSTGGVVGDWDREVVNMSGMVVAGFWTDDVPPVYQAYGLDPTKPTSYRVAQDANGNPTRFIIDPTDGEPWPHEITTTNPPPKVRIEKYGEANFLLLNIPIDI